MFGGNIMTYWLLLRHMEKKITHSHKLTGDFVDCMFTCMSTSNALLKLKLHSGPSDHPPIISQSDFKLKLYLISFLSCATHLCLMVSWLWMEDHSPEHQKASKAELGTLLADRESRMLEFPWLLPSWSQELDGTVSYLLGARGDSAARGKIRARGAPLSSSPSLSTISSSSPKALVLSLQKKPTPAKPKSSSKEVGGGRSRWWWWWCEWMLGWGEWKWGEKMKERIWDTT